MEWEFVGSVTGKQISASGTVLSPKVECAFNLFVKVIAGKIFYAVGYGGEFYNVRVVGIPVTYNQLKFTSGRIKIDDKNYSIPLPTFNE